MSRREWMRLLCGVEFSVALPFGVDWRGENWDVATNGSALLMIRGQTWPEREEAPDIAESMSLFQALRGVSVSMRHIWNWIESDPSALLEKCPRQLGKLHRERTWVATAQIAGAPIDRLLVASYLMPALLLSGSDSHVQVMPGGVDEPTFFYSGQKAAPLWVVAVMSTGGQAADLELLEGTK